MLVLQVACIVAGLLLVMNAASKVLAFSSFVGFVDMYEPALPARVMAFAWVCAEAAAGLILMLPVKANWIPLAIALGSATGAVARRAIQGRDHDCGCFRRTRPVSMKTVRNNALLVLFIWMIGTAAGGWEAGAVAGGGIALGAVVAFMTVGRSTEVARAPDLVPSRG